MTLILTDGWDLYNDPALGGWNRSGGTTTLGMVTGRTSGLALEVNNGTGGRGRYLIGQNLASIVIGFAWNGEVYTGVVPQKIVTFVDSGSDQLELRLDATGRLAIVRGGSTTLATETSPTVINNIWYYFELKVTFASGTSGAYALRRNGAVVPGIADDSAANTISTANAYMNTIDLQGTASIASKYDDLYLLTTSGSAPLNDFLGDIRVIPLLPSGAGTNTNWTKVGASATNWQSVNENPANGDTTYVASSTVGQIDTYAYDNLPSNTSSVFAIMSRFDIRKDDAGSRTLTTRVRSGGSEADASGSAVPATGYALIMQPMELNPVTSSAWTVSDVNSAEFGPKVAS